jgi:hypothetical protein
MKFGLPSTLGFAEILRVQVGSHPMIFLITGSGGQGVLAEKSSFLVPR